jgi:parvulin-like peptidyl-prolyl isomerase
LADSIVKVVKRKKSKFALIAKDVSADKSNASKGGELNWFTYNQMVPEFRDYAFQNSKGDIGIVKTIFGYHVIKITGQKNKQKAVQLVTIARSIDASEATENEIFGTS